MAEYASAIVGLAVAAEAVVQHIGRYVRHVKHAKRDVLDLLVRMTGLYGALQSLQLLSDNLLAEGVKTAVSAKQISACLRTVEQIRTKVARFDHESTHKSKSIAHTIKDSVWMWPFSENSTQELIRDVEAHTTVIIMAMSIDGLNSTLRVLEETKMTRSTLNGVVSTIAQIQVDAKTQSIFLALEPVSIYGLYQENLRLRYAGTGDWFVEDPGSQFQSWLATPGAKMWLYGIPGAGKSVLTAVAIAKAIELSSKAVQASKSAIAYFYCEHRRDATLVPRNILGSLLAQIGRQSQRSCDIILDAVESMVGAAPQASLQALSAWTEEGIAATIARACEQFDEVSIFVDGIDECAKSDRRLIAYLLQRLSSAKIKLFLSSRDIWNIREMLDGFVEFPLEARNVDLELFIAAEIGQRTQRRAAKRLYIHDPSLKGEILDALIIKAGGMFRWVVVQLDYLCNLLTDDDIRSALKYTPLTLSESYERVLLEAIHGGQRTAQITARALKWIVGQGFIEIAALEEALSVNSDLTDLNPSSRICKERIMELCGSLIRADASGTVFESAHFSVKEYLLSLVDSDNTKLTVFGLGPSMISELALTSARFFTYRAFREPCVSFQQLRERHKDHPFMRLAAKQSHLWPWLENTEDLGVIRKLFTPSSVGSLHSWAQGLWKITTHEDGECWPFNGTDVTSLHYAAMIRTPATCDWLLSVCGSHAPKSVDAGTPLLCAMVGSVIAESFAGEDGPAIATLPDPIDDIERARLQKCVLSMLVDRSQLQGSFTPWFRYSALTVAVFCDITLGKDVVFPLLLSAGAMCEDDCLDQLLEGLANPQTTIVAAMLIEF